MPLGTIFYYMSGREKKIAKGIHKIREEICKPVFIYAYKSSGCFSACFAVYIRNID